VRWLREGIGDSPRVEVPSYLGISRQPYWDRSRAASFRLFPLLHGAETIWLVQLAILGPTVVASYASSTCNMACRGSTGLLASAF
jgi:hypothetical protein